MNRAAGDITPVISVQGGSKTRTGGGEGYPLCCRGAVIVGEDLSRVTPLSTSFD